MSHMKMIGVRELRRDASQWLARVRAGEVVVVTDRGRPVATMTAYREQQGYDALLAAGRIAPGSAADGAAALAAVDAAGPAPRGLDLSGALAELRDLER